MAKFCGARKFRNEINNFVSAQRQQAEEKFVELAIEGNGGRGERMTGVQLKFLAFYANARVYGTVFRVAAGSHGGTTLNSRPRSDVMQSYRRARLIFNKNYDEGERVGCEIKKFTGAWRHSMAS